MSHRECFAADELYEQISYRAYISSGSTHNADKARMKRILKKAISDELSDLQKLCLVEHYINGKKMKDIAKELSVNPSTVTRHIKRATEKLRHIAEYY